MNDLQIFNNEEFGEIRTVTVNGEPMMVANDIARALGYARPADAITANCKGSVSYRVLTNGGEQTMKVISEGDIYRLIIKAADQSKNEEIRTKAEKFERWIFDEVLPTIRKHGGYMLGQEDMSQAEFMAKAFQMSQQILAERELRIAEQDRQIEIMTPKAEYFDALVDRKLLTNIRDTATELGIKERELTKLLVDKKFCYRNSAKQLRPYADYKDTDGGSGLFHIKDVKNDNTKFAGQQMLITPKGKETLRLVVNVYLENKEK